MTDDSYLRSFLRAHDPVLPVEAARVDALMQKILDQAKVTPHLSARRVRAPRVARLQLVAAGFALFILGASIGVLMQETPKVIATASYETASPQEAEGSVYAWVSPWVY